MARDERTSISSLKPSCSYYIFLLSGALVISCSDKNLARSALFSGKAMKFDQFLGSGTSRFSITRRIGLLVLLRLFYNFFYRMFPIPAKKTSIRWQNFSICRTARRKMSDRSPMVFIGRNPSLDIVQFRCPRHRTSLKYV